MDEIFGAVTLKEAVTLTTLSESYLRQDIKIGKLRARKAGQRLLITREDLRTYLENLPLWEPGEPPVAANAARRSK